MGNNSGSCTPTYLFCGDPSCLPLCNHNVLWPQWNPEQKNEPWILSSTGNKHRSFTSQCSKFHPFHHKSCVQYLAGYLGHMIVQTTSLFIPTMTYFRSNLSNVSEWLIDLNHTIDQNEPSKLAVAYKMLPVLS